MTIIGRCIAMALLSIGVAVSAVGALRLAGSPRPVATDVNQDAEPALLAQVRAGIYEHRICVYMQYQPAPAATGTKLAWHVWTIRSNPRGTLPTGGYTTAVDPLLAEDERNQNVHAVGLLYNGTTIDFATALALWTWQPDAAGLMKWSAAPTIISTAPANSGRWDKPAIAVAPDGTIYVVAMRSSVIVQVFARRPGDAQFAGPFEVAGNVNAGAPQVMTTADGTVHVLWVQWGAPGTIRLARAPAYNGGTMQFTELLPALATGTLYGGAGASPEIVVNPSQNVRVNGVTVPVAKLDPARFRLSVAWHEQNGTGRSRVRFASTLISPNLVSTNWKEVVAAAGPGHDLNVGMDHDAEGNYAVTYYSFGAGSSVYTQNGVYVTFSAEQPAVENDPSSPPPLVFGAGSDVSTLTPFGGLRFLGEYHDVSFVNGTFKSVGIAVANGTVNPWTWELIH